MLPNKRYQRWRENRFRYMRKKKTFLLRMQMKRALNKLKSETIYAKRIKQDNLYNFLHIRFNKLRIGGMPYSVERWIYE